MFGELMSYSPAFSSRQMQSYSPFMSNQIMPYSHSQPTNSNGAYQNELYMDRFPSYGTGPYAQAISSQPILNYHTPVSLVMDSQIPTALCGDGYNAWTSNFPQQYYVPQRHGNNNSNRQLKPMTRGIDEEGHLYGPGPPIVTGPRVRGPRGANLFCFHLPNEMTNWDLYLLFRKYGTILSVHTMINKQTGLSRGFGFVSFQDPASADEAIRNMNGFRIGAKRLKVQHKIDHMDYENDFDSESGAGSTPSGGVGVCSVNNAIGGNQERKRFVTYTPPRFNAHNSSNPVSVTHTPLMLSPCTSTEDDQSTVRPDLMTPTNRDRDRDSKGLRRGGDISPYAEELVKSSSKESEQTVDELQDQLNSYLVHPPRSMKKDPGIAPIDSKEYLIDAVELDKLCISTDA